MWSPRTGRIPPHAFIRIQPTIPESFEPYNTRLHPPLLLGALTSPTRIYRAASVQPPAIESDGSNFYSFEL